MTEAKGLMELTEARLIKELRRLRAMGGPLTAGKFAQLPALCEALGRDRRPLPAMHDFQALVVEYSDDLFVLAALASAGVGVERDESVLSRLEEFGERYFTDQRNVRRWSDKGIERIASLLINGRSIIIPRMTLTIFQPGPDDQFIFNVKHGFPRDLGVTYPKVVLNDREIKFSYRWSGGQPPPPEKRYLEMASSDFRITVEENDYPLRWEVEWPSQRHPRLFATVQVRRSDLVSISALMEFSMFVYIERISGLMEGSDESVQAPSSDSGTSL